MINFHFSGKFLQATCLPMAPGSLLKRQMLLLHSNNAFSVPYDSLNVCECLGSL